MDQNNQWINDTIKLLTERDPFLIPYRHVLSRRLKHILETEEKLISGSRSLSDFALGHEYFGLHFRNGEWIFREWAPNASKLFLIGDMTDWRENNDFNLTRINDEGVWQISLPADKIKHGDLYRLRVHWPGGEGDRIPAYARRVVQDESTKIFNAQVWQLSEPYHWMNGSPLSPTLPLFIYEAHIGMAQEEARLGTYREFKEKVLPRILHAGYNAIQLMAIQEHPYYGSFGYQEIGRAHV